MDYVFGLPHVTFFSSEPGNKKMLLALSRNIIVEKIRDILCFDIHPTILHESNGRPFIKECPEINISISHTKGATAFILDKNNDVAVDIEVISERACVLFDRFTKREERTLILGESDPFYHTLFFSAKETSFKLMNRFASTITDFSVINIDTLQEKIYLRYLDSESITVRYKRLENHVITWICQNTREHTSSM